jgi:uncharacterized small protein (DUF1192 family)
MTYRDELHNAYSDTFKEAHGFRPRHDISHMSDADLEAEIAGLNTYGWQEEIARVAHEAGEVLSWEAIGRMTVGEIAHRIGELRAKPAPTSGDGWRLS